MQSRGFSLSGAILPELIADENLPLPLPESLIFRSALT